MDAPVELPNEHPRSSRLARYGVTIVALLVVVGALVAVKGAQIGSLIAFGKKAEAEGPPPEVVSTAPAVEQTWEATLTSVGNVASGRGVAVSTDVAGVVTRIAFESGAVAKRGQLLVELDARVERSQFASATARRDLAAKAVARTRALADKGAISAAQLDNDEAQLRTTTTEVETIAAQIAKKSIRAPFAGKLGIRAVNVGQYLNPGTPITVIETTDAVHVDFTLPQQHLADIAVGMPVRLAIEGDAAAPVPARLAAIDPTLDPVSRTIRLRADVNEAGALLAPGMFVRVAVILPRAEATLAVPATAVVHAPYGDSVFVLEEPKGGVTKGPDGAPVKAARQQFVRVGGARGDFVAISEGLKPRDEVVTAGAFKLRNEARVIVDNARAPTPKLDPHPTNR